MNHKVNYKGLKMYTNGVRGYPTTGYFLPVTVADIKSRTVKNFSVGF